MKIVGKQGERGKTKVSAQRTRLGTQQMSVDERQEYENERGVSLGENPQPPVSSFLLKTYL